nr:immunoglobulin light chain junction region [Macaca mulatta]
DYYCCAYAGTFIFIF